MRSNYFGKNKSNLKQIMCFLAIFILLYSNMCFVDSCGFVSNLLIYFQPHVIDRRTLRKAGDKRSLQMFLLNLTNKDFMILNEYRPE